MSRQLELQARELTGGLDAAAEAAAEREAARELLRRV